MLTLYFLHYLGIGRIFWQLGKFSRYFIAHIRFLTRPDLSLNVLTTWHLNMVFGPAQERTKLNKFINCRGHISGFRVRLTQFLNACPLYILYFISA